MSELPTGTITFLFTDIEGSTRLWERYPEAMGPALARHDACLMACRGYVFKTVGDRFCAAFHEATDALDAAIAVQRQLRRLAADEAAAGETGARRPERAGAHPEGRPLGVPLRTRVALHSGTAEMREGDYFGPTLSRISRLDLLARLVDKSLVKREEPERGGRYRLSETVRQYGWQKLREAAEDPLFRRRHAAYYLELAEQAGPERTGLAQGEWLDRLEWEHDNLRAALDWAITSEDGELGLRLGAALSSFWEVRGYRAEGRERLAAVLALAEKPESGGPERAALRARALRGLGVIAYFHGDYEAARAALEESLRIGHELGDPRAIAASLRRLADLAAAQGEFALARSLSEQTLAIQMEIVDQRGIQAALSGLAWVAREQGDLGTARALLERSLAISRELNARSGVAYALNSLGETCFLQGDLEAAHRYLEESLGIWRELGDRSGTGWALYGLGAVADFRGDYDEAQSLHDQSLAIRRPLADKWGIADSLNGLGRLARHQGDAKRAEALCREGLALAAEQGNKRCIAECLEGVAAACSDFGFGIWDLGLGPTKTSGPPEPLIWPAIQNANAQTRGPAPRFAPPPEIQNAEAARRAARLFAAAMCLRDAIGSPLFPVYQADKDRSLEACRAVLGEEGFAAAWAEGWAMPLEHAIQAALEDRERA